MDYWHMSGAGNTFVVVDVRGKQLDLKNLAMELCRQTGADGLMAADDSAVADFRLHFYNSDGLRGEMCGNGARCICRFAHDLGIAGEEMTVQTDAGLVYAWRIREDYYRIQLNLPSVLEQDRKTGIAYVELGDPGIPHAVLELPDLQWSKKTEYLPYARQLRYDPAFPKGANINLFTRIDDETVQLLTYERGVEDYTLACGTGSASVALVLWKAGRLPGGRLRVENPGGVLTVALHQNQGQLQKLLLEGPVEILSIQK